MFQFHKVTLVPTRAINWCFYCEAPTEQEWIEVCDACATAIANKAKADGVIYEPGSYEHASKCPCESCREDRLIAYEEEHRYDGVDEEEEDRKHYIVEDVDAYIRYLEEEDDRRANETIFIPALHTEDCECSRCCYYF